MKELFSILSILVLFLAPAHSQEEAPRGLLNFVNLIPGSARCAVSINGKEMMPEGMICGAETGWFSLPAGHLNITAKSGELRPVSDSIALKANIGTVIAIYLLPNPKLGSDGSPLPPKIRLKAFRTYETGTYCLKIVSLCRDANTFEFGPVKVVLKPSELFEIRTWSGAAFDVSSGGKVIGKIADSPQKENCYVFVAPAADGTFFAAKANADQLGIRR